MVEQDKNNSKILNPERGVSLIITFFIMIIILAVILSISVILYSEVKVMRNMGNSVISYYAAESGIEKVLYYDRQVLLPTGVTRGLCTMFNAGNANHCKTDDSVSDKSIYCNGQTASSNCSPSSCTNCTISFSTSIDNDINNARTYNTTATINPTDGSFVIKSAGSFGGTQRKIEISIGGSVPNLLSLGGGDTPCDAYAEDEVSSSNAGILTLAEVILGDTQNMNFSATVNNGIIINHVQANIYIDSGSSCLKATDTINLTEQEDGSYQGSWGNGSVGQTYYVIFDAENSSLEHHYWKIDSFALQ